MLADTYLQCISNTDQLDLADRYKLRSDRYVSDITIC